MRYIRCIGVYVTCRSWSKLGDSSIFFLMARCFWRGSWDRLIYYYFFTYDITGNVESMAFNDARTRGLGYWLLPKYETSRFCFFFNHKLSFFFLIFALFLGSFFWISLDILVPLHNYITRGTERYLTCKEPDYQQSLWSVVSLVSSLYIYS